MSTPFNHFTSVRLVATMNRPGKHLPEILIPLYMSITLDFVDINGACWNMEKFWQICQFFLRYVRILYRRPLSATMELELMSRREG